MKKPLICPYCNELAIWCENKEIYGRNYGKSYMCWLCKPCNAYVGCHNNSKKPLGTLADAELREWRKKVHQKIDPIWKSGRMTRKNMYKMLNRLVNKEFHVGQCDIEMCKKILDVDFLHEKKFVRPTLERIINLRNY